jgi:hypothetical protein
MKTAAASPIDQDTTHRASLFAAFALRDPTWKLGFTTGAAQRITPLEAERRALI